MKIKNFYKTLAIIAIPIMLQNLMQTFINMLDTIMIGRLGSVQIAAVGLGNQVFFIMNMILFGINSGGSVFIAQYWGKQDIKGIKHSLGIMLILSVLVSTIITVAAFLFPKQILSFYSPDPEVIALGAEYLRVVSLSYIMTAISFAFTLAFRSIEHVKLPMFATGISLVVNATFNALFIFKFGWGVKGAAFATLLSRSVEMILTLTWAFVHKYEACGTLKEYFSFSKKFVKDFLLIAFPVIVNETFWGLGNSMQNVIFAHAGTDAITAFNMTGTISQLTWVFFIGLGNGMGVIIGKLIGAGETVTARNYAKRSVWFFPLTGMIIGFLLFPLSKLLPIFFNVEPEIIKIAQNMMLVLMCLYPVCAFNMNWIVGVCRAGGDTIFAAVSEISCLWIVSIPMGFIAAFVFKVNPVIIYICLQSEQIAKVILGFVRVISGKWMHDVTKK